MAGLGAMNNSLKGIAASLWVHRSGVLFASSNVALQATTIACQLIVMRLLGKAGPRLIGIWATVMLVNGYLLIARFGFLNGMNREYPYLLGKARKDEALQVLQTAQACTFISMVITWTVLQAIGLAMSVFFGKSWDYRFVFMTMAVISPLQLYAAYLMGTLRAHNRFSSLGVLSLVQILLLIVTLVLPWRYGFEGLCWRQVILACFVALAYHVIRPVRVQPAMRKTALKLLFTTGGRLFTSQYLINTARSFPRLALRSLGGSVSLGLFAPVNALVTGFNTVAANLSSYIYPKLTYRYARDQVHVGRLAMKAALLAMACLSPFVAGAVLMVPWLIRTVVPDFAEAIPAAQVALPAGLLECMSIAIVTFASTKAWKAMYVYLACGLVIRGGCALGGYWLCDDRLLGVAWGMLAAAAMMAGITWLTVSMASRAVAADSASSGAGGDEDNTGGS